MTEGPIANTVKPDNFHMAGPAFGAVTAIRTPLMLTNESASGYTPIVSTPLNSTQPSFKSLCGSPLANSNSNSPHLKNKSSFEEFHKMRYKYIYPPLNLLW